MGHVVSLWSHRHTVHRIRAGWLVPTNLVRYHPGEPWQKVDTVRDESTPTVATVKIGHVGTATRWMSPSAFVEAIYAEDDR